MKENRKIIVKQKHDFLRGMIGFHQSYHESPVENKPLLLSYILLRVCFLPVPLLEDWGRAC